MSDYFRVMRGIELDETVRYLQGAGRPGTSADTNDAAVGSVYTDNQTGDLYTKITAGSGTATWRQGGGAVSLSLYAEYSVTPVAPAALGTNSVAIGSGAQTDAAAHGSIAFGDQSLTRLPGSMVQASGRFASTGDAQAGRYVLRTHTINGLPTEMFIDGTGGSERLALPDDSTWTYKVTVVGHRTDGQDGHAGYTVEGVVYRMSGANTTALLGSPIKNIIAESDVPWDVNISTDGTAGALKITVTGQAGKVIRWVALVETVEITN